MPSTSLAANWNFFKKTLNGTFGEEIGSTEKKVVWSQWMDEKPAEDLYFDVQEIVGVGNFEEHQIGQQLALGSFGQGLPTRVTIKTFGKRLEVPETVIRFHKYRQLMLDGSKELARAAKRSMEYQSVEQIDNAFTATGRPDGVALCSSSHPLKGGGTASNAPGAVTPSNTALRTFVTACKKMPGTNGTIAGVMPKAILCPVDIEQRWHEIVDSTMRDDTTNNTTNVVKGLVKIIGIPHMASTTNWILQTDAQQGFTRYMADEPAFRQSSHDGSLMKEFVGFYRLADHCPNFRGALGSNI